MGEVIKLVLMFVLVGCSTVQKSLIEDSSKLSKEPYRVLVDTSRNVNVFIKKSVEGLKDQVEFLGEVEEVTKLLKKIYIVDMTNDRKKLETYYTYMYGLYGYLKQTDRVVVETFGVQGQGLFKRLNKSQRLFQYNANNQIVVEKQIKYTGKEKLEQFQINYSYNDGGYLINSLYDNDAGVRFRNYFYNKDSVLIKVQRDMPKINYEIEMDYTYDNKQKLIGIDTCLDNQNSKTSTYEFDDNINPYSKIYPDSYALVFPEVLSENNIVKFYESGKKYTQNRVCTYQYDDDGYPVESVCKFYKCGELQRILTTKFYYYPY